MVSPCDTELRTSWTARAMTTEPDVSATMSREASTGTPAESSVERFRVKRASAILVVSCPKIGSFIFSGSTTSRTLSSRPCRRHQNAAPKPSTPRVGRTYFIDSDSMTSTFVGAGRSPPRSVNIFSKIGTMKISIPMHIRIAMQKTTTG